MREKSTIIKEETLNFPLKTMEFKPLANMQRKRIGVGVYSNRTNKSKPHLTCTSNLNLVDPMNTEMCYYFENVSLKNGQGNIPDELVNEKFTMIALSLSKSYLNQQKDLKRKIINKEDFSIPTKDLFCSTMTEKHQTGRKTSDINCVDKLAFEKYRDVGYFNADYFKN